MDPNKLPKRALFDTGVFIRAIGDRRQDPESADCRDLLDAMIATKRNILIAAPTYSEILRGKNVENPPIVANIRIATFDEKAARLLGQDFPESTLVEFRNKSGLPLHYYKYDALIVATAVRWEAQVLVCLDKGMAALARHVGLRAAAPADFREDQLDFQPIFDRPVLRSVGSQSSDNEEP